MPLHDGMTLTERYKVLRALGEGGMGAAYLVEDGRLGRQCVIKEVLTHDTTSEEQFGREAQLLAGLRHPNLPVVYDYFFDQGYPYLVMEYVAGTTLDRLRDDRSTPFEIHDVLKWAQDLLDALRYIHEHEPAIIHRDIKPQNVCITPQNKAVLLDFGIARRLDRTRTSTAARAFTHGYAPIEQYPEDELRHLGSVRQYVEDLRAEGIRTGPYTDIYGLGATLYYALTLFAPPDAGMRVLGESLHPIQETNPDAPDFLAAAVVKALAVHPRERYQSAAEMLAALQPETRKSEATETPVATLRPQPSRPLPQSNVAVLDQELIYIPVGEFLMGSDNPEMKEACRPQHRVDVEPYCIGCRPVTNADYQRFIDNNPNYSVPHSPMRFAQRYNWDRRTRTHPAGLGEHPVVLVSWGDALAYCRWLSKVTGYRCRLPTEAEWEKAACWDVAAGRALWYPWGDEFDEARCNVDAHGELRLESSPVGVYSPAGDSPYGLVDVAGNVWEWTGSLYHPYPYDASDGREDPDTEGERVVRGGAYDAGPVEARCAWRNGVKPDVQLANIGFRVACDAGS